MLNYRLACASDMERCIEIRGMTNDNPMTINDLNSIGVNAANWCPLIESGVFKGTVCEVSEKVIGFCWGEVHSGEILALAVLPDYEGKGIGTNLLSSVVTVLKQSGSVQLWLAASPDPKVRAHGFYRRLGWTFKGTLDEHGDQILVLSTI